MTVKINMAYSEPHFDTPQPIKDSLVQSLMSGKTKYSHPAGESILRQAISEQVKKEEGVSYNPKSQILITPGVRQAWYYLFNYLLLKGLDVIIFEPCWNYLAYYLKMKGANIISYPIFMENFEPHKLECLINHNTKLLVLNNPTNPTGKVWKQRELEELINICEKYNFYIAVDEMYKDLVYLDKPIPTFLQMCDEVRHRSIIFRGFSKSYAMTGWRVGYILSSPEIIKKLTEIQMTTIANVPPFIQEACVVAIKECKSYIEYMRDSYKRCRDILFDGLMKTKHFQALKPDAGIFMLMDISTWAFSSEEAQKSLLKYGILTNPGIIYGKSADKFLRLSYCTSEECITEFQNIIHMLDEH